MTNLAGEIILLVVCGLYLYYSWKRVSDEMKDFLIMFTRSFSVLIAICVGIYVSLSLLGLVPL